jgi:hypothetical protein
MNLKKSRLYGLLLLFLLQQSQGLALSMASEPLNDSDNELFLATDRSIPESWYSRLLEVSMHIWADFDMLQRGGNTFLPDHLELLFDASIGKLVHLNWCLEQMIQHKKGAIHYDEVHYFVQIMQSVSKHCLDIVAQSSLKYKAESTQKILRSIMDKIEATFLKR